MTDEETKQVNIDNPYIKLSKNSRGYTWDIKVIGHDIEKLVQLNAQLEDKFGSLLKID